MKTRILSIIGGLFFTISYAQNDSVVITTEAVYHANNDDYFETVSFKIGGGVFIPQGKLKSYFGVSPFVELSADFPLRNKKSIELAVQFVLPKQEEAFQYIRTIDTLSAKATFMFNPMLKFKKGLKLSANSQLNIGLGLGASVVKTNARNPFYEGHDDQDKYESITAFLVSPALDYKIRLNANETFTIGMSLNYSPYKVEGALKENIGGLFFVPKIAYHF